MGCWKNVTLDESAAALLGFDRLRRRFCGRSGGAAGNPMKAPLPGGDGTGAYMENPHFFVQINAL